MLDDLAKEHNELLFFTPDGNAIELISLDTENGPKSHKLELPFKIKSLHPLSRDQYLLVADHASDKSSPTDNLFSLKKQNPEEDPIPTLVAPITQGQGHLTTKSILRADSQGLTDYGLKKGRHIFLVHIRPWEHKPKGFF